MGEVQEELDGINAEVQRRHAAAIKTLEAERKKVLAAIAAFEKKAKPVLARSMMILKLTPLTLIASTGPSRMMATRMMIRCSIQRGTTSNRLIVTRNTKVRTSSARLRKRCASIAVRRSRRSSRTRSTAANSAASCSATARGPAARSLKKSVLSAVQRSA